MCTAFLIRQGLDTRPCWLGNASDTIKDNRQPSRKAHNILKLNVPQVCQRTSVRYQHHHFIKLYIWNDFTADQRATGWKSFTSVTILFAVVETSGRWRIFIWNTPCTHLQHLNTSCSYFLQETLRASTPFELERLALITGTQQGQR